MLQQRSQIYFWDRDVTEPVTETEEKKLLIAFEEGDYKAKEELICRNLRLVAYICKKFSNTGLDIEDLMGIGTIGLIKGIDTYNLEKDIKLATYVSRCIENEILLYIRRENKRKNDISLEEPISVDWEGNELTMQDILEVEEDKYKRYENMEQVSKILECILNSLETRDKLIIFLQLADVNQREIGTTLGVSQSYVSRLIRETKKKIPKLLKQRKNERYSVKVVGNQYQMSTIATERQAEKIKTIAKERKIKVCYENKKISLYCILDEETYKLLAYLIQILEA